MIDIQDFEKKEIRTALKKLVLETFLEITEETTPSDKSTLLYISMKTRYLVLRHSGLPGICSMSSY